jgi:hypothetical protein
MPGSMFGGILIYACFQWHYLAFRRHKLAFHTFQIGFCMRPTVEIIDNIGFVPQIFYARQISLRIRQFATRLASPAKRAPSI